MEQNKPRIDKLRAEMDELLVALRAETDEKEKDRLFTKIHTANYYLNQELGIY